MDRVAHLKDILAQNPGDVFARYGLALEYANTGDTPAALAEFERLLKAHPDYTPGYQMAAQTLLAAGRRDEARALFEKGIACAERNGNSHARSEMQAMLDEMG